MKKEIKKIAALIIAAVLIAVNTNSFIAAGGLYPGGFSGLTLLIQRSALQFFDIQLPYTLINVLLNLIPVYIGFKYIGKKFTIYSCVLVILSSIMIDIIPGFNITSDILLISVFGGIISGLASSITLSTGISGGGTDLLTVFLSEKKNIDAFNIILCANSIMLLIAGILFGWDKALYSIIFQFVTTQVLKALYKNYQKSTLFIVTNKANEIHKVISENSNHSSTIINGEGTYDHKKRKIVYSVVASSESKMLMKKIKEKDPDAFINEIKTEQLQGRFYLTPRN